MYFIVRFYVGKIWIYIIFYSKIIIIEDEVIIFDLEVVTFGGDLITATTLW